MSNEAMPKVTRKFCQRAIHHEQQQRHQQQNHQNQQQQQQPPDKMITPNSSVDSGRKTSAAANTSPGLTGPDTRTVRASNARASGGADGNNNAAHVLPTSNGNHQVPRKPNLHPKEIMVAPPPQLQLPHAMAVPTDMAGVIGRRPQSEREAWDLLRTLEQKHRQTPLSYSNIKRMAGLMKHLTDVVKAGRGQTDEAQRAAEQLNCMADDMEQVRHGMPPGNTVLAVHQFETYLSQSAANGPYLQAFVEGRTFVVSDGWCGARVDMVSRVLGATHAEDVVHFYQEPVYYPIHDPDNSPLYMDHTVTRKDNSKYHHCTYSLTFPDVTRVVSQQAPPYARQPSALEAHPNAGGHQQYAV